ncbi:hypothetical protein L2E82_48993 [Cichorium intybus]|uniref:Uncharacterized protein n=1 Tax=Cichorium intybus TaxID=13427 RepID=A0ACB8YZC2_CICIN|nr:hypothetical protein L2E82_48993 [Cichorium intybus]
MPPDPLPPDPLPAIVYTFIPGSVSKQPITGSVYSFPWSTDRELHHLICFDFHALNQDALFIFYFLASKIQWRIPVL